MKKPVIELKNIKHSEFASEETHCYEATVYVDGKRFCIARNAGHGGCDEHRMIAPFTYADLQELNKRIAATYEPFAGFGGKPLEQDLEMICGDLINRHLDQKMIKRLVNKGAFIRPDSKPCEYISYKKPKGMAKSKFLAAVRKKLKQGEVMVEDMPLQEALAHFNPPAYSNAA